MGSTSVPMLARDMLARKMIRWKCARRPSGTRAHISLVWIRPLIQTSGEATAFPPAGEKRKRGSGQARLRLRAQAQPLRIPLTLSLYRPETWVTHVSEHLLPISPVYTLPPRGERGGCRFRQVASVSFLGGPAVTRCRSHLPGCRSIMEYRLVVAYTTQEAGRCRLYLTFSW